MILRHLRANRLLPGRGAGARRRPGGPPGVPRGFGPGPINQYHISLNSKPHHPPAPQPPSSARETSAPLSTPAPCHHHHAVVRSFEQLLHPTESPACCAPPSGSCGTTSAATGMFCHPAGWRHRSSGIAREDRARRSSSGPTGRLGRFGRGGIGEGFGRVVKRFRKLGL